jgi:DNA-binding CsgD family transcriptional regulator
VRKVAKWLAVAPEVIGREQELDELEAVLAAVDELPAAFLVAGEPGIGKTSLWRAGLELASARGFRVLRATPATAETRLSFAAVADLLEPVLAEALSALPPPQRVALEVALLLEDSEGRPPDHRAVSFAFLGVLRALRDAAPLVVAVDDVQWLDGPSAFVLEFALRRLQKDPVLFLLAQRTDGDDDRLPLGLDRAFSDDRLHRVSLGALSLGALHRLLRERLRLVLPRPRIRRLHELSGGNPFYALELARAVERGSIRLEAGEPLPSSLGTLVNERIAGLPEESREALVVASALSQPTIELLEAALGRDPALGPALEAQVVELERDRIRFAHPLLASGVYWTTSPAERHALHWRLAQLVPDAEERARHLALGVDGPDADVAAALEEAAARARARGASAAAAELGELSRRLTPPDRPVDFHRRTIATANACFDTGDPARATELLEETCAEASEAGTRAEALAVLARLHRFRGDQPLAAELARRALAEAGSDDRLRAEAALALAATLMLLREDLEQGVELAALAAEHAARSDDVVLESETLCVLSLLECLVGNPQAAATLQRAPEEAEQVFFARTLSLPTTNRGVLALWTDGPKAAEKLRDGRDLILARDDEGSVPMALANLAVAEYLAGRWDDAAEAAGDAFEAAVQTGQGHNEAFALATRALVRGSRGDEEGCRADAARALELAGDRSIAVARINAVWALGVLELSLGRAAETANAIRPQRERLLAAGVAEPGTIRFLPDEIEALVALGRIDEAETLLGWLEERGRALDRVSALAAAARCRGLLALAGRDTDAALACFEDALREHDRADMPFERARTLLARGSALRHARRRRDARETIEEARASFASLGAVLWEQKAADEIGRIGGRRASGDELTPAEERVAALVAEGLSNKEAAAALFLTERTVEFHLTHVYRKLGVRSRSELARRLLA